jgi:hypothetical protein
VPERVYDLENARPKRTPLLRSTMFLATPLDFCNCG